MKLQTGSSSTGFPAGFIFISNSLIAKLTEDELKFVLYHELGHVMSSHSVLTGLMALGKRELIRYLADKFQCTQRNIENLIGLVKTIYSLLTKKKTIEEQIKAENELEADKFAILCQRRKEPGLSVLHKLSEGKIDAPSHFTLDGCFVSEVVTYEERIKAIKSLLIIKRIILKRRFHANR